MRQSTRWRRVRLILLSTVLLALVAYTGCDIWAGRRIAAEVAKLESRYGSLSDAPIAAPEVPATENRARLVNAAVAMVNNVSQKDRAALSGFMRDPSPMPIPAELRSYIDANADAIRLAREFVTRPRSSFDVDYRSSGARPNLMDIRNLSTILYLAARQSMDAQQSDDAAALIAAGMSMSAAARHEPDLITQLIRIAVADIPTDALQRLLETSEPSRPALEELARVLAENREPLPMTVGLLGEVRNFHHVFSQAEAGRSELAATDLGFPVFRPLTRLARPWLRWGHARYLENARVLLDIQTGPRPRPSRQVDSNPPRWAFVERLSERFTIGLYRAIESGDDFSRELGAAEVVVALRRYRLDHGRYPDALSVLVPQYVPSLPIDPGTGKPPVYARDGAGFTVMTSQSANYAPTKRPTATWRVPR